MGNHANNQALDFLPKPPKGHFWDVSDKDAKAPRSKPLKLSLREAFRIGSPVGETIGWEYSEANDKTLTETAHKILVTSADRKKYVGTSGV